jgi:lipopolysaccharide/colanic/teichoic acid biosynthesis glycosyltransferase
MKVTLKYHLLFIRIFDISFSFVALIFLLPLFILVSLLIKVSSFGPIFFKQKRVGKNLNIFTIYKFRTMSHDANRFVGEVSGSLNVEELKKARLSFITTDKNDLRITPVGRILRKSSLDELPQLINVLMGEMSFVGPRPDTPVQFVDYTPEQWILRHKYLPGITGLSQVYGRSNITSEKRIYFDLYWIENISIYVYFKIIFFTLFQVISRKGSF